MLATAINLLRSRAGFVQQFMRNPRAVGSITPSSLVLCQTMAAAADWEQASRVAELGAGNGVLTKVLLNHLAPDARLHVFEISTSLIKKLRTIEDHRLDICPVSAERLSGQYDVIFSGLPLLSLPTQIRHSILARVHKTLAPGGVFIQFQYTSLTQPEFSRYFTWERQRVMKNVPPAWVYICRHHWQKK